MVTYWVLYDDWDELECEMSCMNRSVFIVKMAVESGVKLGFCILS